MRTALLSAAVVLAAAAASAQARDPFQAPAGLPTAAPEQVFAQANDQARRGDLPRALALYRGLHDRGVEAPSLYWNWAQVASARGAWGEALWALLRARELEPFDPAIERQIDAAREAANLDVAELEPEPLAAAARIAARFHLALAALVFAAASLVAHAIARLRPFARGAVAIAGASAALAVLAAGLPIAGSFARPTAVVVDKGAALVDAASPTANALGTLREGEVVPVLGRSGDYLRVQDSSGARGWAHADGVRPLGD